MPWLKLPAWKVGFVYDISPILRFILLFTDACQVCWFDVGLALVNRVLFAGLLY